MNDMKYGSFNSTLVRLKPIGKTIMYDVILGFQFHIGSIKTWQS